MRRWLISLSSILVLVALTTLVACGGGGGGSSDASKASKVAVTPTTLTLAQGNTFQLSGTVEDASGNTLSSLTVSYAVATDQPGGNLVSVTVNGGVCAGKWDSLTTPVICTPATGSGKAVIRVSYNTISTDIPVYVFPPVDNIAVTPQSPPCVSQGKTVDYGVVASYKGSPVSIPAPAFSWFNSDGDVIATVAGKTGDTDTPGAVATAVIPGVTKIFAKVGNIVSTPATFTECPVAQISIKDSNGGTSTSSPLATAASSALTTTLTDSAGQPVTTSSVGLTWMTSQPVVASVSSGTITAGAATGFSSISASCTPPACNKGLGAVYSNVYLAQVTGTNTSTTVYVGSAGTTNVYPVTTSNNTVGTAIAIADKPNSMLFNGTGTVLYIGTNTGLVAITPSTNTATGALTSVPGKILAVAPDGSALAISNFGVPNITTSQVFIYSTGSGAIQTLAVPNATAAVFSPDNSKLYILGGGTWTAFQTGAFALPQPLAGANTVDFNVNGAFAAIAGSDTGLRMKATCNDSDRGVISTSTVPTLVAHTPDGQHFVAGSTSSIDYVNINSDFIGYTSASAGTCAPAIAGSTVGFATPSLTPKQLIVTPDGTKAYVLSNLGSLVGMSISGTSLTDASIPLANGASPTTGGVTTDSKFIWVGGSDNNLHVVDLNAKTDTPVSLTSTTSGFTPDFVAVQPH